MWSRVASASVALVALAVATAAHAAAARESAATPERQPPQLLLDGLFAAVQEARVFADSKTFADAVPRSAPEAIVAEFRRARPATPEALRGFVDAHFMLPPDVVTSPGMTARVPIAAHIDALWGPLARETTVVPAYSSELPLPQRYVVPGGRFRELYYWDSYFTMLGLAASGQRGLVESMVRDFASLIDSYGRVPNGTRTYYLSRSQPPFFFAMVALLTPDDPAVSDRKYLSQLRREHRFWMRDASRAHRGSAARRVVRMPNGSLLNRYWDDLALPRDESYREDRQVQRDSGREPRRLFRDIRAAAESGWDFSSRWFTDAHSLARIATTEIVPVDLNALLFGLEQAIAAGCERAADAACAGEFRARAAARHVAIDRYLWDARAGTYLDYRWTRDARMSRVSAAALYPLFIGLATHAQSQAVAAAMTRGLLKAGGLVPTPLTTGQQWDAPNGWAPLQWIAIEGLRRSGHGALAESIACRWMATVQRAYSHSGALVEKYDVVDLDRPGGGGEYPLQDGFGWTNGVMRRLLEDYPGYAGGTRVEACPTIDRGAAAVSLLH